MTTYSIPSWNLSHLVSELTALNKKAAKLGVPPATVTVLGTEVREKERMVGAKKVTYSVEYTNVEVTGDAPRIAGWEFVSTVEQVEGKNIFRTRPDATVPVEFYDRPNCCDHCNTRRVRSFTYILKHEDGSYKQVGKSCLRDFMGHANPQAVAAWLEQVLAQIDASTKDSDDGFCGWGGRGNWLVAPKLEVLAVTNRAIREFGWVPRSQEDHERGRVATASHVMNALFPFTKEEHQWADEFKGKVTDEDRAVAFKTLEWVQSQDPTASDYMHNLTTVASLSEIRAREFGLWCSAVPCYLREAEKLVAKAQCLNEYAAEVGDKLSGVYVEVVSVRYLQGQYGTTTVVKMRDERERTLVWYASGSHEYRVGGRYLMKATVKKLEEYNGWRQTIVTRANLADLDGGL